MFVHELAHLRTQELEREMRRGARARALLRERAAPTGWLWRLPARLRALPAVSRP